MLNPYYVKLKGAGRKFSSRDGTEIRTFGGESEAEGVTVYIGTKQGAVVLRVWEEVGIVQARLVTTTHKYPPKTGPEQGKRSVILETFRVADHEVPVGQIEMFS